MIVYLDASCLIREATLDGSPLGAWANWDRAYSSRLAFVEVSRTLNRLRLEQTFTPPELEVIGVRFAIISRGIERVPITEGILVRASDSLPMHVKALDAVHLASATSIRDRIPEVIFATHDRRLGAAAAAIGFPVTGT